MQLRMVVDKTWLEGNSVYVEASDSGNHLEYKTAVSTAPKVGQRLVIEVTIKD